MGYRDSPSYDVYLEYGGRKVGLILHRDGAGNVAFWPSLAVPVVEQQYTGTYGYEMTSSEDDVPISFDTFEEGAGYVDDPNEETFLRFSERLGKTYEYSRYMEVSQGRWYKSPAQNDTSGISAKAPSKFLEHPLGFFCIADDSIYELSTTTWTEREDNGLANYSDIVGFESAQIVAAIEGDEYQYSADGVTWTDFSDAARQPRKFVVRGTASNVPILWGVDANGDIRSTPAPENAGTAWTLADRVGTDMETVESMVIFDNTFYIFKQEGIWSFDGTNMSTIWEGGKQMLRSRNGTKAFVWNDGKVYTSYGDRLFQFDPADNSFAFIYPLDTQKGTSELNGAITAIAGDADWLYVALKNAAGNTYILRVNPYKGRNGVVHTYIYLGANDCEALYVAGPGNEASSTNPVLFAGVGNDVKYYILPRSGLRPEDDANFLFDTTDAVLVGSFTGVGSLAYSKFLNGGRVTGNNLSSTDYITLQYEIDETGTQTTILTNQTTGTTYDSISTEVEFFRVRPVIKMFSDGTDESPVGWAGTLHATPNPPRRREFTFFVDVADDLELRGGGTSRYSGADLEAFLFGSAVNRCTFYDTRGNSWIVNIKRVQAINTEEFDAQAESGVGVRATEISGVN